MNVPPAASRLHSDEIDLAELVQSLWRQRVLIAVVTGVVTLAALLYALLATPVYQVQSVLRPAQMRDLDMLNATGLYPLDTLNALREVGIGLESYDTRWAFYRDNAGLFEGLREPGVSLEQSFEEFNAKAFTVFWPSQKGDAPQGSFVGIRMEYPEDADGVAILNGLVAHTIEQETQRVRDDLAVMIDNRIAQIERQIDAAQVSYHADTESEIARLEESDALKRQTLEDELAALRLELKTRRLNRIEQLDEAIRIAETLDIELPTTPSSMAGASMAGQTGNVIRTEINNQAIPLYFMGTQALAAERDALQARESDDFAEPRIAQIAKELEILKINRRVAVLKEREEVTRFIEGIAKMRGDIAHLESLRVGLDDMRLVRVDQPAVQPLKPVAPKKKLVVALGLVLGGMLGVMAALMRNLFGARHWRVEAAKPLGLETS